MRHNFFISLVLVLAFVQVSQGQNFYGYSSSSAVGPNNIYLNPALSNNQTKNVTLDFVGFNFYTNWNKPVLDLNYINKNGLDSFTKSLSKQGGVDGLSCINLFETRPFGINFMVKNKFGFAITTRSRAFISVNNFSQSLYDLLYNNSIFESQGAYINVSNTSIKAGQLSDVGFNFSMPVVNSDNRKISLGLTLRRYTSVGMAGFDMKKFNAKVDTSGLLSSTGMDLYGFAAGSLDQIISLTSGNNSEFDQIKTLTGTGNSPAGAGFGGDLGFVYTQKADPESSKPYNYVAGVSILDFGSIKFKNNSTDFSVVNNNSFSFLIDTVKLNLSDVDSVINDLTNLGYQANARNAYTQKCAPPTMLNANVDYAFTKRFFLNVNGSVSINPANIYSIARIPGSFFVTPRYQSRFIDFTLPIGYNFTYQKFSLGASMRLLFLYIGTNDLGLAFGNKSSSNFYFGFNFGFGKGKKVSKQTESSKTEE